MAEKKEHPTRLCAKRPMTVNAKQSVVPGECFDAANPSEARFLCNINKATVATEEDEKAWAAAQKKTTKATAAA